MPITKIDNLLVLNKLNSFIIIDIDITFNNFRDCKKTLVVLKGVSHCFLKGCIDPVKNCSGVITAEAALEQALITRYGCLGRVTKPFLLR
jgi:hypothetical protein